MSDAEQPPQTPAKKSLAARIGDFVNGASQLIFIIVLLLQNGPALAFGATWMLLHLGLLIIWPHRFTFAFARSLRPDENDSARDREPYTLVAPSLMAIAMGVPAVLDISRVDEPRTALIAIGVSALFGAIFFAAVYALDPPIRRAKQMAGLAIETLFWALGALTGISMLFHVYS